jgi:hypothetical protein
MGILTKGGSAENYFTIEQLINMEGCPEVLRQVAISTPNQVIEVVLPESLLQPVLSTSDSSCSPLRLRKSVELNELKQSVQHLFQFMATGTFKELLSLSQVLRISELAKCMGLVATSRELRDLAAYLGRKMRCRI